MAQEKKKESTEKEPDQILVTRAIMDEVKQYLRFGFAVTDEQVLARMQQMAGRPVKLVENIPDDEEVVVLCSLVPVVPGSIVTQCADCGATIYHSKNAPPNSRKICTRCGPRLGH